MKIPLPPILNRTDDGVALGDSFRWALDYEASLLPPDTIFPHKGQFWETVRDCEVDFWVSIAYTGPKYSALGLPDGGEVVLPGSNKPDQLLSPGGKVILPEGERVRIVHVHPPERPIQVHFQPLRYDELQGRIVPEAYRKTPGYMGYQLMITTARPKVGLRQDTAYLSEDFRLIKEGGME